MKTVISMIRGASAAWRCFPFCFILLVSVLGIHQIALAVSPPPDGGYPAGNTAEGQNALFSLTTGGYNTAVGIFSLRTDMTGNYNTAIGAGALFANRADGNSAIGAGALLSNTTGGTPSGAPFSVGEVGPNTAFGLLALGDNIDGGANVAVGYKALAATTSGYRGSNTASGAYCTAVGFEALAKDTATGTDVQGIENSAFGCQALLNCTTGYGNVAVGFLSGFNVTTGANNTFVGGSAGFGSTGDYNVGLGAASGENLTTGSSNVFVGIGTGQNVSSASGVTCIGAFVDATNTDNTTWIGNIYGVTTQSGITAPVVVSDGGQLGTIASSERFKKDIVTMNQASDLILSLRPVTFHYKTDTRRVPQFGLIAEEVAKVNPALVLPDKEGKPYTVRYDAVNAMLLNEFLKEHQKVQKQEVTIAQLKADLHATALRQQKQIEALTEGLQKLSAELEATKAVPQLAKTPGEKGSGHAQAKPNRS